MKRLKLTILVLLALGFLSLGLHYSVIPLSKTWAPSEMTQEADGLLSAELAPPWPLKVNKRKLSEVAVKLSDGTSLSNYRSRNTLLGAETQQGFFINRPQIFIRLSPSQTSSPEAGVELVIPVKLRDLFHKIFFSLAFALWVWIGLRDGLSAIVTGKANVNLWISGVALASTAVGLWFLFEMQSILIWIGFGLVFAGLLGAVTATLRAGEGATGRRSRIRELAVNTLLVTVVSFFSLAVAEGYIFYAAKSFQQQMPANASVASALSEEWFLLPQDVAAAAKARTTALTLPEEWERKPVKVAKATSAYRWHDALHIHDINGFRRFNEPFPRKQPDMFRIMVVGDSLTYGYGIAEDWTYSRLLERALQVSYDAEVINFGRSGSQSEDIVNVVEAFVPQVLPDLLVYAVSLNDFLPSGQGEYSGGSFPFPEDWKEYLLDRTEIANLVSDGYHSLLLMTDLKKDFYDDILSQSSGFRERFAEDVKAMSRFAVESGLPPVIGIVFHQSFSGDERAWELIAAAEDSLTAADFDLISIQPWRTRLEGQNFQVSRWEGHPNEIAHSLVAEALYERLLARGYLEGYAGSP